MVATNFSARRSEMRPPTENPSRYVELITVSHSTEAVSRSPDPGYRVAERCARFSFFLFLFETRATGAPTVACQRGETPAALPRPAVVVK